MTQGLATNVVDVDGDQRSSEAGSDVDLPIQSVEKYSPSERAPRWSSRGTPVPGPTCRLVVGYFTIVVCASFSRPTSPPGTRAATRRRWPGRPLCSRRETSKAMDAELNWRGGSGGCSRSVGPKPWHLSPLTLKRLDENDFLA